MKTSATSDTPQKWNNAAIFDSPTGNQFAVAMTGL
jgi:hypothetical protein